MSEYRRYYIKGGTWFFTVNLRNRRSQLLTTQYQMLRHAIIKVKRDRPFEINAWVVLPEHMHCIWTLPEGDDDFSSRWREIKKQFTHACGLKNIWQPRFWEHAIRNTKDYRHHVDYIYINPVKHGWVKQVSDWPFSTFHRDVARGLYPIDWAGDVTDFSAGSVSFHNCAQMPDATLARLIMPTNLCRIGRPDKAFMPHPAVMRRCLMRRWRVLSCLQTCA